MAFGQQAGPPATGKQVQELLSLLQAAGHEGFRDARGPLGFTQRQAGGKFTRDEADAFIEQLSTDAEGEVVVREVTATRAPTAAERRLRDVRSEVLAAELQRRGWIVVEP